jgi:hypothetical protein
VIDQKRRVSDCNFQDFGMELWNCRGT